MLENNEEIVSYAALEMFLQGRHNELKGAMSENEGAVVEDASIDVDSGEIVVDVSTEEEESMPFAFVVTELDDSDDYGVTCSFAEAMMHNE